MSLQAVGLGVIIVAAVTILFSLAMAIRQAARVNAHLRRTLSSRPSRHLAAIADCAKAFPEAADRLEALRLDGIAAQAALAADAGVRFASDIGLIARTTDRLLETFLPAERGVASTD